MEQKMAGVSGKKFSAIAEVSLKKKKELNRGAVQERMFEISQKMISWKWCQEHQDTFCNHWLTGFALNARRPKH